MASRRAPAGLEAKGRRLWREILAERPQPGPAELVEIEECCRIADRLDRLASAITDGEYFLVESLKVNDDEVREFRLVVNGALAEARQQANTLRLLLVSLGLEKAVTSSVPTPATGSGADPVDILATERAKRRGGNAATEAG